MTIEMLRDTALALAARVRGQPDVLSETSAAT